jgi:acyl carrier protein
MDESQCRSVILGELQRIAPEVEAGSLDSHVALREQVDLDSMDWLNFLIALSQSFRVEIPESVYERLRSVDDLVQYLRDPARAPRDPGPARGLPGST